MKVEEEEFISWIFSGKNDLLQQFFKQTCLFRERHWKSKIQVPVQQGEVLGTESQARYTIEPNIIHVSKMSIRASPEWLKD